MRSSAHPKSRIAALALTLALSMTACVSDSDDVPAAPIGGPSPPTPSATASARAPGQDASPAIVAAANAFLATLSDEEREAVQFAADDDAQKARWAVLPGDEFERDGLMVGNLADSKVDAFLAIMEATLSPGGYEQVMQQWAADDALAASDDSSLPFGGQYYWMAIIGEPGLDEPWQWQFGGHHVTVNATVAGSDLYLTPSAIGIQPARYTADGVALDPLGDIWQEASALVNSLTGTARDTAVLGDEPIDVVLGPGQDGRTLPDEGLPGADMTAEQRTAFLSLMMHYGGLANAEDAVRREAELLAELPQTRFAWYGPTEPGTAAYFRVAGPSIVIEYAPQQRGGDPTNHVHGIYRDPAMDYGGTLD